MALGLLGGHALDLGLLGRQPLGLDALRLGLLGREALGFGLLGGEPLGLDPLGLEALRLQPLRFDPLRLQPLGLEALRLDPLGLEALGLQPLRFEALGLLGPEHVHALDDHVGLPGRQHAGRVGAVGVELELALVPLEVHAQRGRRGVEEVRVDGVLVDGEVGVERPRQVQPVGAGHAVGVDLLLREHAVGHQALLERRVLGALRVVDVALDEEDAPRQGTGELEHTVDPLSGRVGEQRLDRVGAQWAPTHHFAVPRSPRSPESARTRNRLSHPHRSRRADLPMQSARRCRSLNATAWTTP